MGLLPSSAIFGSPFQIWLAHNTKSVSKYLFLCRDILWENIKGDLLLNYECYWNSFLFNRVKQLDIAILVASVIWSYVKEHCLDVEDVFTAWLKIVLIWRNAKINVSFERMNENDGVLSWHWILLRCLYRAIKNNFNFPFMWWKPAAANRRACFPSWKDAIKAQDPDSSRISISVGSVKPSFACCSEWSSSSWWSVPAPRGDLLALICCCDWGDAFWTLNNTTLVLICFWFLTALWNFCPIRSSEKLLCFMNLCWTDIPSSCFKV